MLNNQLTSNSLFHDDEEAKKHREQIYVPLALVERKKSEKREQDGLSPEQGTKLYESQYEEKQRFTHNTFLKEILQQKQGKSQGKRISLIGEPGAGKTTLLQTIANWILQQELGLPAWVSLADLTQGENLRSFEDYLLNSWLPFSPDKRQKVQENFTEQFERRRVWLLLDGVDEIATSGSQTLQNISRQLSGWVGKARVVLTCRLNVWQADVNALSEFETFRLLDFDYPQQVHQFIDNWFDSRQPRFNPPQPPFERQEQEQDFVRGENSKGDRLKVELGKEEKARVRDLVKNPLRLALLCQSWQLYEGSLPETKAELYGQFVEQFYRWKCLPFPIKESKRRELNLALGSLAKEDIDSSGSRFRLRQDFIVERLGNADDENSLFYLALQIGWLNNVGVAAESPTKKVYAFFHATFEEYFAALAIDDQDFFLPRKHKNKPVKGKVYRIFEPQWKQVILLWLGREDVKEEEKEGFVKALTKFQDGCGNFWFHRKIDRGFYEYQAYFLAAAGVGEFSNCTKTDQIVEKIIDWGDNKYFLEIVVASRNVLLETPRKNTINGLVNLLESTTDYSTSWQAAYILGKIDPGNEKAIHALVQILESTTDDSTLEGVAQTLGKIGKGNEKAIHALVQLLASTSNGYIRRQAAESLGEIGTGNEKAINDLVQLLDSTSDDYIRSLVAESLGEIDHGNEKAIHALVQLLDSTTDYTRSLAAESLGKIDQGNEKAIHALVQLLDSTINFTITGSLVAENLEKIGKGNEKAIHALVQLLDSTTDDSTRRQAAYILGKINPGNEKAIHTLVQLLDSTLSELSQNSSFDPNPSLKSIPWKLQVILLSNSSEFICIQAAESLWRIDPGNQNSIDALVQLLGSTSYEFICIQALLNLDKIGAKNQKAIDALVQLLGSTSDDSIYWQAAYSLGKIYPGNKKAIDALVQLLESTSDDSIYWQAAYSLGKIYPGNKKATDALIQLLGSTLDNDIRRYAAHSLGEILAQEQMAKVVTSLKHCLSAKGYKDNSDRFLNCYKIIWKSAQTLPYPEFYQAWHPPFRLKKPRWLS